jgi:nucleoside phosphorylase
MKLSILQYKPILIHTAMPCEAQGIVEYLKLTKTSKNTFENDDILLLVGGIGKEKTIISLEDIYSKYTFTKAINIGISGCDDASYQIGELVCTTHTIEGIHRLPIITVDTPASSSISVTQSLSHSVASLYDMESSYFVQIASKYLKQSEIYVFKVISDYLDTTIPNKDFVKKLIKNRLNDIRKNGII